MIQIQPSPRVDYKDIRITDDGFTRGSGSTDIVQQQPATFVASRTTASAPEAGSQRPQHIETNFGNMTGAALIHPMNELRTKKIWLNGSSSPTRHGNAAEISPKVGQQPFTLQASNTTPASPQSMTHRHISGDLLNTGDAEFLSTRGKHLPRDFYTSEQKAQFRGQRDGATFAYRDVKITESAFTHCTTLKTSPW